jgi:alpha-1,3-rhamnosyltransferase
MLLIKNNKVMEYENPLVTILIITYNSAKSVIETLESAKSQTYKNIELIISDDCSKDNTIEICRDWINKNEPFFKRTELITVDVNTGISPNCNRGFNSAQGEWIKPIAGDDILTPDCISTFVKYLNLNPDAAFIFSNIEIFGNDESSVKRGYVQDWINRSLKSFENLTTAESQYKKLMISNNVCSPSAIYQSKAFHAIGGFDEELKLIEDYPFWINATKKGYKIISIKEKLIRYRVNETSVQTSDTYKVAFELFHQKYIFKNIFFRLISKKINQLQIKCGDKFLITLLILTSLPQRIIWKLKKRF